ncbi:MAG: DUF1573 domain-containing protein [Candidatus Didemnitutus sp.]|nr:DUF1573 domain-containing protein [Candidatus Didemnitutus sp.]
MTCHSAESPVRRLEFLPQNATVFGMRRWQICLAAGCVLGGAFSIAHGELKWEASRIEVSVAAGTPEAEGLFKFTNTGPETVRLAQVSATCDCTVATVDKRVYAPDESGAIRLKFTLGDRLGVHEKQVIVTPEPNHTGPIFLTLRVEIQEPVKTSKRLFQWAKETPNTPQLLDISPAGKRAVMRVEVESAPPEIAIDPADKKEDGTFRLSLRPKTTEREMTAQVKWVVLLSDGIKYRFGTFVLVR